MVSICWNLLYINRLWCSILCAWIKCRHHKLVFIRKYRQYTSIEYFFRKSLKLSRRYWMLLVSTCIHRDHYSDIANWAYFSSEYNLPGKTIKIVEFFFLTKTFTYRLLTDPYFHISIHIAPMLRLLSGV